MCDTALCQVGRIRVVVHQKPAAAVGVKVDNNREVGIFGPRQSSSMAAGQTPPQLFQLQAVILWVESKSSIHSDRDGMLLLRRSKWLVCIQVLRLPRSWERHV
jgi:hypothetical protein